MANECLELAGLWGALSRHRNKRFPSRKSYKVKSTCTTRSLPPVHGCRIRLATGRLNIREQHRNGKSLDMWEGISIIRRNSSEWVEFVDSLVLLVTGYKKYLCDEFLVRSYLALVAVLPGINYD
jgi:hypothetical protein